jgi:hypothetical protein
MGAEAGEGPDHRFERELADINMVHSERTSANRVERETVLELRQLLRERAEGGRPTTYRNKDGDLYEATVHHYEHPDGSAVDVMQVVGQGVVEPVAESEAHKAGLAYELIKEYTVDDQGNVVMDMIGVDDQGMERDELYQDIEDPRNSEAERAKKKERLAEVEEAIVDERLAAGANNREWEVEHEGFIVPHILETEAQIVHEQETRDLMKYVQESRLPSE